MDANPNFQDLGLKLVHVARDQSSDLWDVLNSVDWGDFEVLLSQESNQITSEKLKEGLKSYSDPESKFGFVFTMLNSENDVVGLVNVSEEYSE